MKYAIGTATKSASLTLTKALIRAATVASTVATFGVISFGSAGPILFGGAGLAIAIVTPAQARCLIAGVRRDDVSDDDCLEAQRTGCVRNKLTPAQYTNCLAANRNKRPSCVIKGEVRDDLNGEDCEEAKATGCVRRLQNAAQYKACLDAQPVKR